MSATRTTGAAPAYTALPGFERLSSAGEMGELALSTVKATFLPPYTWPREFVIQSSETIRRSLGPGLLSVSAFALGLHVFYVAGLLQALGTQDRLGGAMFVGFSREIAVWVTLMILAGVAGAAMTADLASRKIRDELDALEVLGIDLMRSVIVPRVLALVAVAPLLGLINLLDALVMGYVTAPIVHTGEITHAAFLETVKTFTTTTELLVMMGKMLVSGVIVGVVCCTKGLKADRGAEGVGKAVNEAVLISFFAVWTVSIVGSTIVGTLFPSVSILRG
ncbi:MAG: MlaE family ABC transporter permease [Solirubrobacteraceae bacterium]